MSDFQAWANNIIVAWSGQESWRDNFMIGAAAVLLLAFIVGIAVWASR